MQYNSAEHAYYETDDRAARIKIPVDIPQAEFNSYAPEKLKALMSDAAGQVYLMRKRKGGYCEFSPGNFKEFSPEKINAILPILRCGQYSVDTVSEAYEHDQRNKSNPSVLEALNSLSAMDISSIQKQGGGDLCKALCRANSQEAMNLLLGKNASFLYHKGVSPSDLVERSNDPLGIKLSMVYEGAKKIHGIPGGAFHHALPNLLDHAIPSHDGKQHTSVLELVMSKEKLLKRMLNTSMDDRDRSPVSLVQEMLLTTHPDKTFDQLAGAAERIVAQGPTKAQRSR